MTLAISEQTFRKEVLNSTDIVLVNFWAPWCGLCRLIDPLLAQLQVEAQEPIKLVRVNADENLQLARDYRLKTLPTLLLFHQGQLIHRLDAFYSREDILLGLRQFLGQLTATAAVQCSVPLSKELRSIK